MKILPLETADDVTEAATIILRNSLEDPEKRALVETLFDDDTITKDQFFATAFAMGASSAIWEIMYGNIVVIREERAIQGNS